MVRQEEGDGRQIWISPENPIGFLLLLLPKVGGMDPDISIRHLQRGRDLVHSLGLWEELLHYLPFSQGKEHTRVASSSKTIVKTCSASDMATL